MERKQEMTRIEQMMERAEAENESESRSNGTAGERQEKSRTGKRRV